MEQKQLDEIDESYFGDEFIEEDLIKVEPIRKDDDIEEIKIESVVDESANLDVKTKKKTKKVKTSKDIKSDVANNSDEVKEKVTLVESKTVDPDKKVSTDSTVDNSVDSVKRSSPEVEKKVEFNPWDDKNNPEKGLFSEVSTWKAVTGIAVILLIFSVFTQGFQFSENEITGAVVGNVEGKVITIEQAQERVVNYVNTQLLQPPFIAQVVKTTEFGNLYKLTLSIADEEIDSYLTKDGRLFFPQGFDISYALTVETVDKLDEVPSDVESDVPDVVVKVDDNGVVEVVDNENVLDGNEVIVVDSPSEPVVQPSGVKTVSIAAKKWLFSPHEIKVNQGDTVSLTIEPQGLDFTFAIQGLGVEKEISGTTVVEFVANKQGTFEFSCSSCEEWRGMVGTVVVK